MSRTILLADDSVTIQKVIELTFMDEDYEVVAVGNGDDALEQLDEITPDFVIADVHMPGADGYDVAKHSKSLRPEVPVLLLVGTFEPFDEEQARKSGCDAYLKKPFDSQELQRLVEQLSAEARGEADLGEGPLEATGWRADAGAARGAAAPPAEAGAESPETPGATQAAPGAEGVAAEPLVGATGGEAATTPSEPEESKAEPFSIGLDEEEPPPPTRVEPPLPTEETPGPGDVGSTAGAGAAGEPELPAAPPAEPEPEPPAPSEPTPPVPGSEEVPPPAAGPLSDEDVDRIARRVVELVGEGPIREVAWEVVPDLAEVVIRGRLRELESRVESGEADEPGEAGGPAGPPE